MWDFTMAFREFARREPGSRDLDEDPRDTSTKADFSFFDDGLFVEVKELSSDRLEQVQKWINQICQCEGLVIYGRVPVEKILARVADPESARRKLHEVILGRVRTELRDASGQLKESRKRSHNPDAPGVLVLNNKATSILDPQFALWSLHQLLGRRKPSGEPLYSGIDCIWAHFELPEHTTSVAAGYPASVTFTLVRDNSVRCVSAQKMLSRLQLRWSKFLMRPLFLADEPYTGGPLEAMPTRCVGFRAGLPGMPTPLRPHPTTWGSIGEFSTACRHCDAALQGRADKRMPSCWLEQPQPDMVLMWWECPDCGGATDVRVADVADPNLIGYLWDADWGALLNARWRQHVHFPERDSTGSRCS